jgi:cilia- and flagella-associated protein 43
MQLLTLHSALHACWLQGAKKIEVLRQIKDFCRGTHMVKWEASRCEMLIEELREKVRDIQLLHVTREMQVRGRELH